MSKRKRLTAPDGNAPALQFADYGAHGQGHRDGVEVGGVRRHGEDGNFGGRRPLAFHFDPMEPSAEPHGPHDHT